MYSLTIHFGPNAICWAFLFKEKEKAEVAYRIARDMTDSGDPGGCIEDDFGQSAIFTCAPHGVLLEDLDLIEAARIQRALAEERCKVKLMTAAKADPVIRQAMNPGTQVLQPRFNG